ncbi:MAG: hypothetical protein ACQERF_09035 [Actinomycetota bacterium]
MSAPGPSSAQFNQQIGNQVLDFIEGLFANGLNQANRIGNPEGDHSYDPNMRMSQPFENAGYGPQAAGLLGLIGLLATPDPTDIMQVAKVANRSQDAYRVVRGADDLPVTGFRSQTPSGRGPYTADMPEMQGQGFARSISEGPEAARHHISPRAVVHEGQLAARQHGLLDLTGPAQQADPVLMQRLRGYLAEVDPDGRMVGALDEYESGYTSGLDLLVEMERTLGANDLGRLPRDIGMDLAKVPHNRNIGRPVNAPGAEYIAYSPDAWRPNNVYTPDEFERLFPRR